MRAIVKHFLLLFFGITFMSAGVGLSRLAQLGTSPISSIPNVTSIITGFTLGQLTIVFMILLIVLEAFILRRQFSWQNILQLIPGIVFGFFIDGFVKLFGFLPMTTYWWQLFFTAISILLLSFGVYLEVNSQAIIMSGEGLTAAISLVTHTPFPTIKVRQDITMMLIAAVLALIFRHSLSGIREGTVITAILTGRFVSFYTNKMPRFTAWMTKPDHPEEDKESVAEQHS